MGSIYETIIRTYANVTERQCRGKIRPNQVKFHYRYATLVCAALLTIYDGVSTVQNTKFTNTIYFGGYIV